MLYGYLAKKRVLSENSAKRALKVWASDIDEATTAQILSMTELPFLYKHLAVMPDAHWGCGSTVGTVIATCDAIIPAAVGVECRKDIGVLDEIPGAYKNIDTVIADQVDLVKPLYQLKQILCVKG